MKTTGTQQGFFFKRIEKIRLWLTAKTFGLILAIVVGLKNKERMSHNNGIAAKGKFTVDPEPGIPPNDFWIKGRVFPLQIRHAAATFYDDAMNLIRSIAIKLSDEQYKSPFDIEMNTGSISLFWSAASFLQFAKHRKQKYGLEYEEYYKRYPIGVKGAQEALRRNPTSYTNLEYYGKTPYKYEASDSKLYYAKYRVIPYGQYEETGKIGERDLLEVQNQRIIPGEKRSRNYLKDELIDRLKKEVVKYNLQVQTREAKDGDDPNIFNCCIDWPTQEYPWRTLGVMELSESLSWDESNLLTFSVHNLPKSLGILPAESIYDYNSLNYMRYHSDIAKRARLFCYKLRGMPKEIPNNDNRNSSVIA